MPDLTHTTALVKQSRTGDSDAARRLLPLVYEELRRIAGQVLRHQKAGHTLQPTALVHEAFVKLVDQTQSSFADQAHFAAVASRAMRQIIIDHARAKGAIKRGGNRDRVPMADPAADGLSMVDVIALDEALRELEAFDHRQAQVVELRFFGGLSVKEAAEALDVSERTVELDWRMARAWLSRRLSDTDGAAAT